MKSEETIPEFESFEHSLSRLKAARAEAFGLSWNEEGFMALGWAILDMFRISRELEDSMWFRSNLATEYLRVVCPELSLPCELHSKMLYEFLQNEPEDEDGLLYLPLMKDALQWPWPWFRAEDTVASPHQTEFYNRSLAERVAQQVSSDLSPLCCKSVHADPLRRRDLRPEIQAGLAWLERLQKELPPHNRIPYLLAGHMLELHDAPAGLKWLEIEERNHPDEEDVEELREDLLSLLEEREMS